MADLPYIEAAIEVKITGQDSTGNTVNYVNADANGNLSVKDYADGPVTPGAVAAVSSLIGGQYNTVLPTLTNTQQSAVQVDSSGRLLVAGASTADIFPATQNITAQDVASTSTTGANGQSFITGAPTAGSTALFSISSQESIEVQVTGTWTGTLMSEISIDGGTTWFTRGLKQSGASFNISAFIANFEGGCNSTGITNYRVRATATWTGTATVKIVESLNAGSIIISNPIIVADSTTFQQVNIHKRSELRTASSLMLIGATESGSSLDINMWSTTVTGSGTSTVGSGINTLSTGTTANSSVILNSLNRARFIPGTINAVYSEIRLSDTGATNNIRRWGAYDTSDGVYFQLNGTTFGIGVRSGGSDTIVTSFNSPKVPVIDTNFHTYEIQYTTGQALFYQDGNLIHTYTATTTALSTTPHYLLGYESTNSGGSTSNESLYLRTSSIMRYGEEDARPRYFHPIFTADLQSVGVTTPANSASLTATLTATKAGSLLVVTCARLKGTVTITDSASQTYTAAITQAITAGPNTTEAYTFYKANTAAGVTSVTITSTGANDAMVMIVTEYTNISTTSPLDQTSSFITTPAAGSWTSNATSTTSQAIELLVGSAIGAQHNTDVFSPTSSFTSLTTINGAGGGNTLSANQSAQFVTSTGAYTFSGTVAPNDIVGAGISTFTIPTSALSNGFTVLNAATTITIGAGSLRRIVVNTLGTGSASVTFYDNTTNSGRSIAILSLTEDIGTFDYNLDFNNGLTMVVNSSSADFTVIYD